MLDPMAGQRGASSQKGTKRLTLGRPFWESFSVLFRILVVFFGDLISSRFFEGIWHRFWRVFGSFFGSFFGCVGSLFRCACGSGKCGLDLLFAVNQAHGHLPTQAEKVRKYANFAGRFLDSLWDDIWEHFWHHFGSILGPFWRQNCQKRRSNKRLKKRSENSWILAAPGEWRRGGGPPTDSPTDPPHHPPTHLPPGCPLGKGREGVSLHCTVLYSIYCTVLHLYCTALYCTVPYCAVSAVLYCTVQSKDCAVLYCTVQSKDSSHTPKGRRIFPG